MYQGGVWCCKFGCHDVQECPQHDKDVVAARPGSLMSFADVLKQLFSGIFVCFICTEDITASYQVLRKLRKGTL